MQINNSQKVLIVGGGFAGIKSALELDKDRNFSITLLTDKENFRYYPALFKTATGGTQNQSSIPLSNLLKNKTVKIIIDRAVKVDRDNKWIITENDKKISYDVLILATGVVTNYFNIVGLSEYAYGIKSIEEAEKLKSHLHKQLIDDRRPDLNYIIIGGGPTGIELAGQLPEYLRHVMKRHQINHRAISIELVEAAPRLLPKLPKDASRAITKKLRSIGVKLYLGQSVQSENADSLVVNGKSIKSHTVIWTAGVTNHPFFKDNSFKLTQSGKVVVDEYLRAENDIFVLGDNASTPYSGMAQTALYDAVFVAKYLQRGSKSKPYKPKKPITIIPVGSKWAAVCAGQLRIYGWLGWMLREMADLVAFHDLEPWWRAGEQFMNEFVTEESCPVCATASQK